jgi:hypothetical protein
MDKSKEPSPKRQRRAAAATATALSTNLDPAGGSAETDKLVLGVFKVDAAATQYYRRARVLQRQGLLPWDGTEASRQASIKAWLDHGLITAEDVVLGLPGAYARARGDASDEMIAAAENACRCQCRQQQCRCKHAAVSEAVIDS